MRKTFSYLFLIAIFISCGRNEYEKQLVGNWYSYDENEKFEFSEDSLKISHFQTKTYWKATKDSIKFNIKPFFSDSISKISLKYYLENDTLFLTPNNTEIIKPIKFVKANNFLDFLFSKNKVKIKLPTNYNVDHISASNYGIKVFLELKNNSIYAKTEYSDNLKNLKKDLQTHITKYHNTIQQFKKNYSHVYKNLEEDEIEKLWVKKQVHFLIFADKEISKKEIRPFYEKLKEIDIVENSFYIYDIDESNYVSFYLPKGVKCE